MATWKFIPRLPGEVAWKMRPFHTYTSIDAVLTALSEYKSPVRGLLELKTITDVNEIKLSNTQWLMDTNLSAEFGNYEELKAQIDKLKRSKFTIGVVDRIYLYGLGYFLV